MQKATGVESVAFFAGNQRGRSLAAYLASGDAFTKQHGDVVGRIVSKTELGAPCSEKSVVYLSDLSPKDKWDHHRANTMVIGQHYDADVRFRKLGDHGRLHHMVRVLRTCEPGEWRHRLAFATS